MLELTAQVIVTEQERFRQSDGSTRFRDRILERMARELAERMMATPGAVEIEETTNPATGDLRVRARVFVANREADVAGRMTATEVRMRQEAKSNMLDAMRYAMPQQMYFSKPMDPLNFGTITADKINVEFLKGRIDRQIRGHNTKTPGEALPVVKVKVRKIQMPEEV